MRRLPLLILLATAFGCSDQPLGTAPTATKPSFVIADAASEYKPGFYWLPPMVRYPTIGNAFDGGLAPTVQICELRGDDCGVEVAVYSTESGPGGEVVQVDPEGEFYNVKWHTNEFDLSTSQIYRVSIRAGVAKTLLGYADVQPVSTGAALRNIDTEEFIGLKDGRTLNIKFRIETGIVGSVEIVPVEPTIDLGATQQFVAVLSDLHGNPIEAHVVWESSDESVAMVDEMGLATSLGDGVTTITATSERMTASATLTVAGGMIVAVGATHACALNAQGRAYCWGSGAQGQIGNGSTANQLTPVLVAGGHVLTSLVSGNAHTCGLTQSGDMLCWGFNVSGQLGNGTFTNRTMPSEVLTDLHFTSMSAGGLNTCALTAAGAAYCWGDGGGGVLGNGEFGRQSAPVAVLGNRTFISIDVGTGHVCGVSVTGEAYCWGSSGWGEAGIGPSNQLTPSTPVSGNLAFASISAGADHTCGLTTEGVAYCWGRGVSGQLGYGGIDSQRVPIAVFGDLRFSAISAGGEHTCAITTSGRAYCWGDGFPGVIGNGSIENQVRPVPVSGDLTFVSISSGSNRTCGVAAGSKLYCWGTGALGTGSTAPQPTPALVTLVP